ncbi:CHAT domain-containing protein [Microbispora hainanensis]|uniref:CHAT domain-containing protein n=1 Tax=Microbispora hainanensis TaxID=568844 RepID=UPI0033FF9BAC
MGSDIDGRDTSPVPPPLDRADARAWCAVAVARLSCDQPEAALEAARQAIGRDPQDEWGHRLVGAALERLGRDTEAVAAAREAVRLAPGSWAARLRLASALRRIPGRWREAWAEARRAVRFAPDEPDPHVLCGDLALLRGDHDGAARAYGAALRRRRDHPAAWVNLGLALLRWQRPRDHHDPAWEADPRDTGRARRALETWSRQVRVILAVATAGICAAVLLPGLLPGANGHPGTRRLSGVQGLLGMHGLPGVQGLLGMHGLPGVHDLPGPHDLPAMRGDVRVVGALALAAVLVVCLRQAARVGAWTYVPGMLRRDLRLFMSVALGLLTPAAYLAELATLPEPGAASLHEGGGVWAGATGLVLLNPVVALAVRLLAETWRGRPLAALRRFATALHVPSSSRMRPPASSAMPSRVPPPAQRPASSAMPSRVPPLAQRPASSATPPRVPPQAPPPVPSRVPPPAQGSASPPMPSRVPPQAPPPAQPPVRPAGSGVADRGRAAAADRAAARDIAVAYWIVAARAWQAAAVLMLLPFVTTVPFAAVACLAVPVGLLHARTTGAPRPDDRWLATALTAPAVAALCAAAAGAAHALMGPGPAVVALWRCAWGALAFGAAAFAVRAVRAWWRGGPGPWRASLVPSESRGARIPGDLTPSAGLSEEVRHAAAYSRNVVLACTGADGPRALAVSAVTSVSPAGEFRLIAGDEAWDAVRRDPRVVLFVGDPRFWAEVRGVAVPDDDVLRVTPRQVLMREYPGRHQARTR